MTEVDAACYSDALLDGLRRAVFCRSLCCSCRFQVPQRAERVSEVLDAIANEFGLVNVKHVQLRMDGFALLPSTASTVLRDGDLLHVLPVGKRLKLSATSDAVVPSVAAKKHRPLAIAASTSRKRKVGGGASVSVPAAKRIATGSESVPKPPPVQPSSSSEENSSEGEESAEDEAAAEATAAAAAALQPSSGDHSPQRTVQPICIFVAVNGLACHISCDSLQMCFD